MWNGVKIMGIVNVTDDSFVELSRIDGKDAFARRVDTLLEKGADIIDIGAVSSRPGSSPVDMEEEWARLEPVLETAAARYGGVSFSIDTFRASIVTRAYCTIGRFTVNDISAGQWDDAMIPLVGRLGLRYVAMHLQGTFETMHDEYHYDDVTTSVLNYFRERSLLFREAGVENWVLDPGFGFSKSNRDNMTLLENLDSLTVLQRPVLVGISRKRFTEGDTEFLEKLAVSKGAAIIRTHLL